MSARTQSSRQVTVGRMRSPRRSGRADEEKWSSGCASVCRFMRPPFADSTHKKHAHPEPKCDSEEQQDHECVTKLLNWRICITKTNKHFQKKCWNSSLAPPPLSRLSSLSPTSSNSSGVPSCLFTDSKGSFSITPVWSGHVCKMKDTSAAVCRSGVAGEQ